MMCLDPLPTGSFPEVWSKKKPILPQALLEQKPEPEVLQRKKKSQSNWGRQNKEHISPSVHCVLGRAARAPSQLRCCEWWQPLLPYPRPWEALCSHLSPGCPLLASIEAPHLPLAPLQQHLIAPVPKEALKRIKGFPLLTKDSPIVASKGGTNLQKTWHTVHCNLFWFFRQFLCYMRDEPNGSFNSAILISTK